MLEKTSRSANEIKITIDDENSVFSARDQITRFSRQNSLDSNKLKLTEVLTIVSELARNMYEYAGGGIIVVSICGVDKTKLKMIFSDTGPGFDAETVLSGNGNTHGLGLGIMGSKKLSDSFLIRSGKSGTMISCIKIMK